MLAERAAAAEAAMNEAQARYVEARDALVVAVEARNAIAREELAVAEARAIAAETALAFPDPGATA